MSLNIEQFSYKGKNFQLREDSIVVDGKKHEEILNYKIREKRGCGSFSSVYRARHIHTNVNVALKVVRPFENVIDIEKCRRRLQFEVDCLKNFHHPHIIRCHEDLVFKDLRILVLEYIVGEELFDYIIRNEGLTEDEARLIFQQILCGVGYLHINSVCHRDLKPENILISKDGIIKIIDFGLGNRMTGGMLLESSVGSPNYAAPEVIEGIPYDSPVDIWSCGVILYSMVSCELPFDEERMLDLFRKIQKADFEMKKYFSDDLKDLLSRLIVVDPRRRLGIEQIKNHRFFRKDFPDYLRLKVYKKNCAEKQKMKVNKKILHEAMRIMNVNVNDKTEEKCVKSMTRRNSEFAVTYDIIRCYTDQIRLLKKFRTQVKYNNKKTKKRRKKKKKRKKVKRKHKEREK